MRRAFVSAAVLVGASWAAPTVLALDGGPLRVTPRNGWKAFEVISVGNDVPGDGFAYASPGTYDGVGAWLSDASNLRLSINHETSDASVSEVNLNLTNFRTAIANTIAGGTTGGVSFVSSARQAYGRWSSDGGGSYTATSDNTTTAFSRFCSGQLHPANTFGTNRGFVDPIYMTGEESTSPTNGRMFALDMINRDFYRLGSAAVGIAPGGVSTTGAGMPAGPWENACLIDTGETNYVAILMSPDSGDTSTPTNAVMQLYIGHKGKGFSGGASSSFLARNGLAYGNYYYLNDSFPGSGTSTDGRFDTTIANALVSAKLEDVDTSPTDPTKAVIGVQETGLFTFDFDLQFDGAGGSFDSAGSSFSLTKVLNHVNDTDGQFGDADNVDWTDATTLNNVTYSDGLIFVNEDSGTANGETWLTTPAGAAPTLIADTVAFANATETSGVLDISRRVGYRPGSVLLTSNQGTDSSLTVLINPAAVREPRHWDVNGTTAGAGAASPTGLWNGAALNFNTDSTGGGAGILVADTSALDTVVFSAGNDATAGYTVTLSGTRAAGQIVIEQGNVTFTTGTLASGVFDVAGGASATVSSTLNGGASNNLTKNGAGTLTLSGATTYTGGNTVNAGTLVATNGFKNGGPLAIASGAKAVVPESTPNTYNPPTTYPVGSNATGSKVSSLTITGTGVLDLGNSDLAIDHNGSSPLDDIRDLLTSGFNGGDWDGAGGIISNTLNANNPNALDPSIFGLGYAENADLPTPYSNGANSFFGVDVDNTTTLIKFTWVGDLNLDGFVDFQDLSVFNTNYDNGTSSGRYWFEGDFNYDGFIDFQDLSLFNTNYDPSKPSLPEPGGFGILAATTAAMIRSRRRARAPAPR